MPVPIHNKQYYTVVERVNQLVEDTDGNYSIKTDYDLEHYPVVIVTAILTIGENSFTGHALGDLSDADFGKNVKGKILETIETHAIGRALASSGRNGDEFASADEMLQSSSKGKQEESSQLKKDTNWRDDEVGFATGKNVGKAWKEIDEGTLAWILGEGCKKHDWKQKAKIEKELRDAASPNKSEDDPTTEYLMKNDPEVIQTSPKTQTTIDDWEALGEKQ